MSVYGLDEAEVARIVAATGGGGDDPAERFARAAWLHLAEPGDAAAALLVGIAGAGPALEMLLAGASARRAVLGLLEHDGTGAAEHGSGLPEERMAEAVALVAAGLARWRPRLDSAAVLRSGRVASRLGHALVVPSDDAWPPALDDLGVNAPLAVWCDGDPARLAAASRSLSVVGSRSATEYGTTFAVEASAELAESGFSIVSGAAYGIDGAAHRGALAARGATIAVLAGGLDRRYPSGHAELIGRIAASGAVLSEMPCGQPPTKWRFRQRNRLIAALGRATVVVEAAWRSGTMNTAGHASQLGRPLGAVPGPVSSATSAGCHRLLREYDAVCVTTAAEMTELAGGTPPSRAEETFRTDEETRVLDALSTRAGRGVEDVARRSGLSVAQVASVLGLLDLSGEATASAGEWRRVPPR